MSKRIKNQSQIFAVAALLFLLCGVIAHVKSGHIDKRSAQLKRSLTSITNSELRQRKELTKINHWLAHTHKSHLVDLKKQAPRIVQRMESNALYDHLHVNHLTMGKRSVSGTVNVDSFIQGSHFPGVKSVHIHAYGNWETLAGLNHWIHSIRQGPVAITHLTVRQGHYDIRMQILGK